MATAKNSLEGRAEPFLERIERLHADLDSKRGAYMAECRVVREDIKVVLGEAKEAGIPVKALKGLVEFRKLEKKQAAIADGYDPDEAKVYEHLVEALGELGAAAAKAAGHAPKNGDDDERDLRPRNLQENDKSRADQDALDKVGRGAATR